MNPSSDTAMAGRVLTPSDKQLISNQEVMAMINENTELTKSVHRILVGEPEYKRPGLVEVVDRHEKLIIRGGGVFASALFLWEVAKVIFHLG